MPLNQEQQRAVEYLDGPLLVLAGPGTGKTQLLSAKVQYILENAGGIQPENILCLTFTEAGAQNMRDRLQTMIGKEALDVNIFTYHAFGSNLMGRYKNYAETFDRKLDAPIDETMRYKMVHDIQQTLPAMDILRGAETAQIIEVISKAKDARLTAADLLNIAERNIADSKELSEKISPYLLALKPREKFDVALANTYQPILEILLAASSPEPIARNTECLANILAKELNQVITAATAEERPKTGDLNKWRNNNFEKALADPRDPNSVQYRLKDHIRNKKLYSLAHIMAKYEEKLAQAGLFDFSDMIECAIDFLKNDRGFQMQMSETFQYILLDEFQDTNVSQFELIKLLTDYEKPVVMAVGDDDQAIYAFQGANYSNLREFQDYYQAEVITLLDNYRSTGEILDLSHQLVDQIDDSFAKNYQINKTLRSMKDQWAGAQNLPARVCRHEFPGSVAEYYWIAAEIRKLLDAGENPTDIAIIAPKHRNLMAILPYLKNQNIDVTYEKRDNLLQDAKMNMIITLAKFIQRLAAVEQPVENLLEILAFEFWELPADVVLRAVEKKWGQDKTVLEYLAGDPQLEAIGQFLANLTLEAKTAPLELWLDYLIGTKPVRNTTSPFLGYYQQRLTESELLEFYENLEVFRQKVVAHLHNSTTDNADSTPKLVDFVNTISDFEFAKTPIMRTSVYRDSGKAIQVMTAHKSKGLEFKHVFLTSVDDSAWGKAEGNNNQLTLPKNVAHIRHTGITDDEHLRLFFVAVTRAKENLIMTNSRAKADGSNIARLRYLSESSRDDEQQLSLFLREPLRQITMHEDDLSTLEKIETLQLSWVSAYQKLTPDTMTFLRERMQDYRLNPTDLTSFVDIVYAGPQQVYQNKILRAPGEPANMAICYGNLIHKVFEQITAQKIDDTAAIELFRTEANKAILPEDEKQLLLEKGEHDLKIALQEFTDILRHEHAKAEVDFGHEHIHLDTIPLTGKIDHLEINPDAKTIEVYDFKTGKHYDKKWNSQPTLFKYALQLGFYKLLLNRSPAYANYRVTKGHILFVSPDQDAKVYDKVYEYNEPDEQLLKNLIHAVYNQMRSLSFVQDDELFIQPEKSNTMKQVLAFIDKIIAKDHEISEA